jgi:hypothetical protein
MTHQTMTREQIALEGAFITLKGLAEFAPMPTQQKVATRAAGWCLWGLGVEERDGFKAQAPVGAPE